MGYFGWIHTLQTDPNIAKLLNENHMLLQIMEWNLWSPDRRPSLCPESLKRESDDLNK